MWFFVCFPEAVKKIKNHQPCAKVKPRNLLTINWLSYCMGIGISTLHWSKFEAKKCEPRTKACHSSFKWLYDWKKGYMVSWWFYDGFIVSWFYMIYMGENTFGEGGNDLPNKILTSFDTAYETPRTFHLQIRHTLPSFMCFFSHVHQHRISNLFASYLTSSQLIALHKKKDRYQASPHPSSPRPGPSDEVPQDAALLVGLGHLPAADAAAQQGAPSRSNTKSLEGRTLAKSKGKRIEKVK